MEAVQNPVIQWVTWSVLGGLLINYFKAWYDERTKIRKPSEQVITLGELELYCERKHEIVDKNTEKDRERMKETFHLEVYHLQELVQKDLDHGKERFDTLDKKMEDLGNAVIVISGNVKTIAGAINGGVKIQE